MAKTKSQYSGYNVVQRKRVQTRIDRVLVDNRIITRITNIQIIHTKVSDHNAVTWAIETKINKKKKAYEKILVDLISDPDYAKRVKELFLKETDRGIDS